MMAIDIFLGITLLVLCAEVYSVRKLLNWLVERQEKSSESRRLMQDENQKLKESLLEMIELNIELNPTGEQAKKISEALCRVKIP